MFTATKPHQLATPSKVEYIFQLKSSLANRLKYLFYNCLLNYDNLFPDGSLPSPAPHNLSLFRAIQPPADFVPPPHLRLQRGNPKEISTPFPSLQQFSDDVVCGLNLSLPKRESLFSPGVPCGQSVSCSWLLVTSCYRQHSHNVFSAGLEKAHRQPKIP